MAKPTVAKSNPTSNAPTRFTDSFFFFDVQHSNGIFEILNDQQAKYGVLDTETTPKLRALRHIQGVRFEAVVSERTIVKRKASSKAVFPLSINILGPRNASENVSQALRSTRGFLQHPHALYGQIDYDNPDMLVFPDHNPNMAMYVGSTTQKGEVDRLNKELHTILNSLNYVLGSDALGPVKGITCTLTQHQTDGVQFILQREDAETTRQLSARMSHAINYGTSANHGSRTNLGGLIADVMGMGKTLTILCSIMRTADDSHDFACFNPGNSTVNASINVTKATLVVLPSARMCLEIRRI